MRVYLMTDMEGVAGVLASTDWAGPGDRYYETARELTTLETNAAIEGFLAAGATEFLVADGHGWGALDPLRLHPAAKLLAGRGIGYPFGADRGFDVACQIGQHAKANADGGHLAHTGSFTVEDLTVNGRSLGEMGLNMLFCAYYQIPTILVCGDQAGADEARDLVPTIEAVAVKEGLRRGPAAGCTGPQATAYNACAVHLHPTVARDRIRTGAERALRRWQSIPPFWLDPPYVLRRVMRPETPGGPRAVLEARADDLLQLLTAPLQRVQDL